jgi:hypothetical protein
MKLRYLVSLAALGLAACEQAPPKGAATAEGEILPGSASDAMLPLDTLRSQAPLAPKVVSSDAPDAPTPPRAVRSSAASPAATPEPAPSADPEPAAEAVSEN